MNSPLPANPAVDPLLDVRGLGVAIRGRGGRRIQAVDGVSFSLQRGRILGIVGESGCGKSTTALSILRLLPQAAMISAGEVLFDGEDLVIKAEDQLRRLRGSRISMILQNPLVALDPLFTVGDQLAEPLRQKMGLHGAALRERQISLLQSVSIPSAEKRLEQFPHQMSGGMLQRIVGAIAIACDPQLLIADEPTTALDPTAQAQFLDLLAGLRDRLQLSIIVVTHDFGVTARLCDEVLVMYAGRVAERGDVRDIFNDPRHPYTRALLASIPQPGGTAHGRLRTIDGQPPDLAIPIPGCAFAPRCAHVMPICTQQRPPEIETGPAHTAACWLEANP